MQSPHHAILGYTCEPFSDGVITTYFFFYILVFYPFLPKFNFTFSVIPYHAVDVVYSYDPTFPLAEYMNLRGVFKQHGIRYSDIDSNLIIRKTSCE